MKFPYHSFSVYTCVSLACRLNGGGFHRLSLVWDYKILFCVKHFIHSRYKLHKAMFLCLSVAGIVYDVDWTILIMSDKKKNRPSHMSNFPLLWSWYTQHTFFGNIYPSAYLLICRMEFF